MTVELLKDLAQVCYYIALSISGPLALVSYLRAQQRDRREREFQTYDQLDNKYLEYQKLALQFDLELLEVPDYDPYVALDRVRKRPELVAYTVSFSLFQRAYLMFHGHSDDFKRRQWAGWERLLTKFLMRLAVLDAWQVSKIHFDTQFQRYVDQKVTEELVRTGASPAIRYAYEKTGLLIGDHNQHLMGEEKLAVWTAAVQEYERRAA